MACCGNLKGFAFERRDNGSRVDMFDRFARRGRFTGLDMLRGGNFRFGDSDRLRYSAAVGCRRRINLAAPGLRLAELRFRRGHVVLVFEMFQKIADVQEGVAIEANVNEGRLHTRKNSGDSAFVKTSN
jgi:hypothetical protein